MSLQKKESFEISPVSISVPTAAKMLGISARTCWTLVKSGDIPSFHVGSRVLIPYSALTSFVEQRLAAAQEG